MAAQFNPEEQPHPPHFPRKPEKKVGIRWESSFHLISPMAQAPGVLPEWWCLGVPAAHPAGPGKPVAVGRDSRPVTPAP